MVNQSIQHFTGCTLIAQDQRRLREAPIVKVAFRNFAMEDGSGRKQDNLSGFSTSEHILFT